MSKLYTKTGDKGTTCLYDMRRVPKGNVLIDFLGDLDEFSAHIGLLCSLLNEQRNIEDVCHLRFIQNKLLDIGSNIATTKERKRTTGVSDQDVGNVEGWIDACEEKNTPLKEFILPGIKPFDAQAHICRAVCRRVERRLVDIHFDNELNKDRQYVSSEILQYVNRLSDYFFALARKLSECNETTRSEA